jgi:hypothetical protein
MYVQAIGSCQGGMGSRRRTKSNSSIEKHRIVDKALQRVKRGALRRATRRSAFDLFFAGGTGGVQHAWKQQLSSANWPVSRPTGRAERPTARHSGTAAADVRQWSTAGGASTLYFSAGLNDENDGLFGSLTVPQANPAFVTQVYTDLLQRPVDATGLAYWDNELDQGVSRQQVVASIENTPEYQAIEVKSIYEQYLHRTPDAAGLSYWTNQLALGATVEQVESGIVGSQEFFTVQGGGTDAGFLTALYQDALGRAPDATGETQFLAALKSGVTTGQVAGVVFGSVEFQTDLVGGFYESFLHRAADANGLAFFVQQMRQGATDQDVIAAIVGSNEYFSDL